MKPINKIEYVLCLLLAAMFNFSSCEDNGEKGYVACASSGGTSISLYCLDNNLHSCGDEGLYNYESGVYASQEDCIARLNEIKKNFDEFQKINGSDVSFSMFVNEEEYFRPTETGNGGNGGNGDGDSKPTYCSNGYQGPSGDPQIDSYCEAAYTYLCSGYSRSSQEVSTNCDMFNDLKILYDVPTRNCQYCN